MVNHSSDNLNVYRQAAIMPALRADDPNYSSSISYNTSFHNQTNLDLTIVMRNGLRFVAKAKNSYTQQKLIIRTDIVVTPEAYPDLERLFANSIDSMSKDLQTIQKTYDHYRQSDRYFSGMKMVIDNEISIEQIRSFNGSVYYSNNDIVISTLSLLDAPSHPYSENTICTEVFDSINIHTGVGIHIDVVDNSGSKLKRYVSMAKKLFEIEPKKDISKDSGIYVTTIEKNIKQSGVNHLVQHFYSFEDAKEQVGVYASKEEALTMGDVKNARKAELEQRDHDFQVQLNEMRKEKAEADAQKLKDEAAFLAFKHEMEIKEINLKAEESERAKQSKLEFDRIVRENKILEEDADRRRKQAEYENRMMLQQYEDKLTRERNNFIAEMEQKKRIFDYEMEKQRSVVKDYYEAKSYVRKDTSEKVKLLPKILGGVGAVVSSIFGFVGLGKLFG